MTTPKVDPARDRHWVCAQRLRERRLALGITQRQVVALLQSRGNKTTDRGLSAMENGRGLDLGLLPDLAESLCCTVTYLLGLTEDPHSWLPAGYAPPPVARQAPSGSALPPVPTPRTNGIGILGPMTPASFTSPGRTRRRSQMS